VKFINRPKFLGCNLFFAILGVLIVLFGTPFSLERHPIVMVLNSNPSIEKYRTVHNEFKDALGFPVIDVDISTEWMTKTRLQNKILDESPDVIFCIGSQAYLMANEIDPEGNIIFSMAINWKRFDLGKNSKGISMELNPQLELFVFKYLFPDIKTIGMIYSEKFNREWVDLAVNSAKSMDINLEVVSIDEVTQPLDSLKRISDSIDAFWVIHDPLVLANKATVVDLFSFLNERKIPSFVYNKAFAGLGAALVISPDLPTIGRQGAQYVESLVLGSKATDESVQIPAGSHLSVNLKVVSDFALNFNEDGLHMVNEIIDE
jgi:putative tryptophan/tyrosine transport system substrate-binding protein